MSKLLFIEGPIQSGKSTLLRKLLNDSGSIPAGKISGFTSQRITDQSGRTKAYRIQPAVTDGKLTPLTVSFEEAGICSADEAFNLPGVFRSITTEGKSQKNPDVFDSFAADILDNAIGSDLIILDEIGGAELLSHSFSKALNKVLESGSPCIGVIKLAESAAHMQKTAGYNLQILEKNRLLREKIESLDGEIIYFDRPDAGEYLPIDEKFENKKIRPGKSLTDREKELAQKAAIKKVTGFIKEAFSG